MSFVVQSLLGHTRLRERNEEMVVFIGRSPDKVLRHTADYRLLDRNCRKPSLNLTELAAANWLQARTTTNFPALPTRNQRDQSLGRRAGKQQLARNLRNLKFPTVIELSSHDNTF